MDFESIKNLTAWELLKLLQNASKKNARLMKENSDLIAKLLNKQKPSEEDKESAMNYQSMNNYLMRQNADNMKLHNGLLAFLKSLNGKELVFNKEAVVSLNKKTRPEKIKVYNFDEFFAKTIEGKINFDHNHPFYGSKDFKEKLLQHYIELEEYEKCAEISGKA